VVHLECLNVHRDYECANSQDTCRRPFILEYTEGILTFSQAERAGSGRTGLIFPLSRYFVAFEIPNRVYVVGKDINQRQVIQLRSPINDIVAGTAYENTESQSQGVILVQQHSPPRLINLQLLSDVQSSTSSRPQKLQEGFNTDTHGLAVVTDMAGVSLVVSHPSGLLERRKLLV
jgi:hypothetical protein